MYIVDMELSKKSVGRIIALIVISLTGLVILQVFLLKYAIELKEQAFRRNVSSALNSIVYKLETGEAATTILHAGPQVPVIDSLRQIRVEVMAFEGENDSINSGIFSLGCCGDSTQPVRIENGYLYYKIPSTQHVTIQAYYPEGGEKTVLVDTSKTQGEHSIKLLDSEGTAGYMYRFKSDNANILIKGGANNKSNIISTNISGIDKQQIFTKVFNDLTTIEWEPIEQRLDPLALDSAVAAGLRESGIALDYIYGVISLEDDSLRIEKPSGYSAELKNSEFKASLFPHDLFAVPNILALYFPDHDVYMLKQIGPLLSSTILFMLIIVFCFIYTIRTIILQKAFGRLMVEFINNMTHEFKTPISSISLACEAIAKPEIISNQDKVARYSRMIKDENSRMRSQVEKILQMAMLENKDFDLELVEIDAHEIINRAVQNIAIQVENRSGKITKVLEAKNHWLKADAVHLSNIIHNLLDNAIKYSPDKPVVTISTRDTADGLIIGFQDKGIGISEKSKKQVFDKYYRVPTGNIHDIKGFGLGLSYVKLMAEAHGGSVRLDSEPGRGTLVELRFPALKTIE